MRADATFGQGQSAPITPHRCACVWGSAIALARSVGERTLCGHIDALPRGMGTLQAPYEPAGAVQKKVADAASAEKMSLTALLGHASGRDFKAGEHLAKHPEYAWLQDVLRDMNSRGWTKFTAK